MEEKDLTKEKDERCSKMSVEIVSVLSKFTPEDFIRFQDPSEKIDSKVINEVIKIFIKNDVLATDIDALFNMLFTAVDKIKKDFNSSLDENTARISEIVYGLAENDISKLSVKNVNDVYQRIDKIKEIWQPVLLDESLSKEI